MRKWDCKKSEEGGIWGVDGWMDRNEDNNIPNGQAEDTS